MAVFEALTDFATGFVQIVQNENVALGALLIAFWLLFYGVFSISLLKTQLLGDDPASKKLGKVIAGTIAAIIVLGSLAFLPPEQMLARARAIMGAFNVVFAVILAILVFLLFKFLLLREESSGTNEFASWFGGLMALYFLSSIAANTVLITIATLGIVILFAIAGWRLLTGGDETTFNDYNYDKAFQNFRDKDEGQQRRILAEARRRVRADSHATIERIERESSELIDEAAGEVSELQRIQGSLPEVIARVEGIRDDGARTAQIRKRAQQLHHQLGRVQREVEDAITELTGLRERARILTGYQANIREIQDTIDPLLNHAADHVGEIEHTGESLNVILNRSMEELYAVQRSLNTLRTRIQKHITRPWERLQRDVRALTRA